MKHPEQVTLRHLLHEITDKSRNGTDRNGERGADLVHPGGTRGAATVYRIEKGTSKDNPNRVGRIHIAENVGDNGNEVITNYFILDTPDGLQIEKYSLISNIEETVKKLGAIATIDETIDDVLQSIARINDLEKSYAAQDELGLSFVSEQEARDLLHLLDDLEPAKKR